MRGSQHLMWQAWTVVIPGLTFAGFALLFTAPVAISGTWPNGHDGLRYHYLLEHFTDAVQHGYVYPRYLPDANGGYGYPTFIFYPPGFFFAVLPFAALFGDTITAVYATIISLVSIGALGAYKMCSEVAARSVAIFAAALFLLTPYLYTNLHVRNDLAELTAMLLCPWTIYFLFVLQKSVAKPALLAGFALGVSVAAVIVSHPATALFLVPSLCVMSVAICNGANAGGRRFLTLSGTAIAIGVVLSAPYWLTLFQMKPYVAHEKAIEGYFTASDHVVYWSQLVSPHWEFGLSHQGPQDAMSFQLGLPHLLLAAAGTIASWRDQRIRVAAALYLATIAAMTPLSSLLWTNLPILRFVQFPWRLLSVIATVQVLCIAGIYGGLHRLWMWERVTLFLLVLASAGTWYFPQFFPGPQPTTDRNEQIVSHRENRLNHFWTYAGANEYTPRTAVGLRASVKPRQDRPIVEVMDGPRKIHFPHGHNEFHIRATISAGPEANIIINQIYLPGWHIELSGRVISRQSIESQLLPDGRMRLEVDAGPQALVAYYDGPPGRHSRSISCAVLLICLAGVGYFAARRNSDLDTQAGAAAERTQR